MNTTKMGEERMSKNANRAAAKQANTTGRGTRTKTVVRWRTEGCVKELKLEGDEVTLKIEPTEAFSAGVDGDTRKCRILFVKEEESNKPDANPVDAKLVDAGTSFALGKGTDSKDTEVSFALLYQMKKDHMRIRVGVDELDEKAKPHIQSIALI